MGAVKRLMVLLLALLLPLCAAAEAPRDADWFDAVRMREGSLLPLLTEDELHALAGMSSEAVHDIVDVLFAAAAGVSEESELKLWKTLTKQADRDARSAENAAYRAAVLPWLLQAFAPGNRIADGNGAVAGAPAEDAAAVQWQTEKAFAALQSNAQGQAYLMLLTPWGGTDGDRCMAVTQAAVQRWLGEIDHGKLSGINGDYQFWLYSAGTPIDYPVVQCGDNRYYMDRMFNRKPNKAGTLFADYRNLPGFRDPNTLIYGHHMRDSSMFHSLTDYESRGFFEAHPYMLAVRADAIDLIEAFAGYVTDGRDHCYDIAVSDAEDMRAFVLAAKEKSDFDAHVEIACGQDHLITLSTCAYNFENARYVVIGRLRPLWAEK